MTRLLVRPLRAGVFLLCALALTARAQATTSLPSSAAAPATSTAPAAASSSAASRPQTAAAPSSVPPASPPSPFSASLTLISQYVTRGLRQTYNHPALQGEFDYAHPSGLFLGTWMSNVSDKVIDNSILEWDLYGGYKNEFHGVRFGGTYFLYFYPGGHTSDATGRTRYTYTEVIPSLGYKFFTVNYAITVSQDFFGYNGLTLGGPPNLHSRYSSYLDVNANFEVIWGISTLLHYGFQNVRNFKQGNFQDLRIGLSKTVAEVWTLGIGFTRAYDVDGFYAHYTNTEPGSPASDPTKNTFLVWGTRAFSF